MKVSPKYLVLLALTAFAAIVWTIVPYCLDSLGGSHPALSRHDADAPGIQLASADSQESVSHRDFVYPVDNIRDPFVQASVPVDTPQPTPAGKTPGIRLTGIIWNDKTPIAILADSRNNSHLVKVGEEIDSARILAIYPRKITIQSDGRTQELALWPEKF